MACPPLCWCGVQGACRGPMQRPTAPGSSQVATEVLFCFVFVFVFLYFNPQFCPKCTSTVVSVQGLLASSCWRTVCPKCKHCSRVQVPACLEPTFLHFLFTLPATATRLASGVFNYSGTFCLAVRAQSSKPVTSPWCRKAGWDFHKSLTYSNRAHEPACADRVN